MSRFVNGGPIPFVLPGGCQCEGSPHPEGDIVLFRSRLNLEGGVRVSAAVRAAGRAGFRDFDEAMERELGTLYVIHGVVGWNMLDDDGREVPVTEHVIREGLSWPDTLYHLVDKATSLYGDETFVPFRKSPSKSSPRGRTAGSTSPSRTSSGTRTTRSKRSSRGGTAASGPSAP